MKFRVLVLLISFNPFFSSCTQAPKKIKEAPIGFKKEAQLKILDQREETLVTYDIEFADTPYKRQTGLMYRTEMASHQGMLFIFEDSALRSFYMKNTPIALDLIFLNETLEIVHIHENSIPNDPSSIPSLVPAKYVLELVAGQSKEYQLAKGMKIKYTKL